MTNIDQFESVFKAADKPQFVHQRVDIRSALVLTDLEAEPAGQFAAQTRKFLHVLGGDADVAWNVVSRDEYTSVADTLQLVENHQPDLICTYRNLQAAASDYPYSLGVILDVLTQTADVPLVVLPHPAIEALPEHSLENTNSVMAITDHLAGDHGLVSLAARFTEPGGTLFLTHVEDEATFERYMTTIAKIPDIDTDTARETILERLLQEPRDYINSCRAVIQRENLPLTIEEIVTAGHHLRDYRRLVDENRVDLLVLHTKDDEQLAMHGLAYPLSVELRQVPLLLL